LSFDRARVHRKQEAIIRPLERRPLARSLALSVLISALGLPAGVTVRQSPFV